MRVAVAVVAVAVAEAVAEGSIEAAGLVVVHGGVQPAYHEPHGGCRLVGWACKHTHWGLAAPGFLVANARDRGSCSGDVQHSVSLDESPSGAVEYVVDDGKEHRSRSVGMQKALVSCVRNCAGLVDVEEVRVLEDRVLVAFDLQAEGCPYHRRHRHPCSLAR